MPSVKEFQVTFDCASPERVARFWCEVLDFEVREEQVGLVSTGAPEGNSGAIVMTFAQVPEPKSIKNRLHLDVRPFGTDQQQEVDRLLSLGASYADVGQDEDVSWVVLADPEGNEFCVLSGNS